MKKIIALYSLSGMLLALIPAPLTAMEIESKSTVSRSSTLKKIQDKKTIILITQSPLENKTVTMDTEGLIEFWDTETGNFMKALGYFVYDSIESLNFSDDGKILFIETSFITQSVIVEEETSNLSSFEFFLGEQPPRKAETLKTKKPSIILKEKSESGTKVATLDKDGIIQVWHAKGLLIKTITDYQNRKIDSIGFSTHEGILIIKTPMGTDNIIIDPFAHLR